MRLYLVDGTYELFRAYYRSRRNGYRRVDEKKNTDAVRGMVQSILSLLRKNQVDYIAIAFDHVIESFRNDLYPKYKSSDGVPEDLLCQFNLAEEAVRTLGIVTWSMIEFEADDALATAVSRWCDHPELDKIIVCSPDKDLAQVVVGTKVVTLNRRREEFLDEERVRGKYGVAPSSIPDFLALVGDTADGIPGIPHWGVKSASAVLSHYGTVDEIPRDDRCWTVAVRGKQVLSASLRDSENEIRMYRLLTTLRQDVPLVEQLSDLAWNGVHRKAFEALCSRLGKPGLSSLPHRWYA